MKSNRQFKKQVKTPEDIRINGKKPDKLAKKVRLSSADSRQALKNYMDKEGIK